MFHPVIGCFAAFIGSRQEIVFSPVKRRAMRSGHSDVDHGFGAAGKGFVVTREAAVEHEPAVGPLDRPPFRDRGETPGPRLARGDFHVDAEGRGVLDEVLTVAAVAPDLADPGVAGGDLVQEPGAGDGVLHARCGDQHGGEKAERVGDDAPLPANDLLARVDALTGGRDWSRSSRSGRRSRTLKARPPALPSPAAAAGAGH